MIKIIGATAVALTIAATSAFVVIDRQMRDLFSPDNLKISL